VPLALSLRPSRAGVPKKSPFLHDRKVFLIRDGLAVDEKLIADI
jgi:hypothetical protein